MTDPVDIIDDALCGLALHLANRLAAARRVSPYHVLLAAPGACHDHVPDQRGVVPGCAYCERRGNCFGGRRDDDG